MLIHIPLHREVGLKQLDRLTRSRHLPFFVGRYRKRHPHCHHTSAQAFQLVFFPAQIVVLLSTSYFLIGESPSNPPLPRLRSASGSFLSPNTKCLLLFSIGRQPYRRLLRPFYDSRLIFHPP